MTRLDTTSRLPGGRSIALSIVIPTYDGFHLLEETLPSVLAAAARYAADTGAATELLVVDDGSRDGTDQRVAREFPGVRLVRRQHNGGFAAACNTGFDACRFPLVALLNNDVKVNEDYFGYCCSHFADPAVFAVTARIFDWDRPILATGGKLGRFRRGFWSVYLNYDVSSIEGQEWVLNRRLPSMYAVGGFATYRKAMLDELGGFCELLSPFYWEDLDLSYRGWKRGWNIHYEPRSIGYHRTSSTIAAYFQQRLVNRISLRNRLLFHWINLHSLSLWIAHVGMLGLLCISRILLLDLDFYRALGSAIGLAPQAWRLRKSERAATRRTDRQIVRLMRELEAEAPIDIYRGHDDVAARHPDARTG